MTLDRTELTKQWKSAGLKQGDNILIHSSLKSFGYVEGGASAVIRSLLDAIGEEGTLIAPTLTGRREDSVLSPPIYDVLQTKCWTGIIPETLRNMENAKRSLHPTHSAVAIGSRKEYLTSGHEKSKSPCDDSSPYYKNSMIGGYIILAGVDQESNTSIHSCEELAGVIYHLQEDPFDIPVAGYRGETVTVTNRLHNWYKPETDFNKLDDLLGEKKIMKKYMVGNSLIRIINASDMFEFTIKLLKKNTDFLLI